MTHPSFYNRPVPHILVWPFRLLFLAALLVLTYKSIVPVGPSSVVTQYDKVLHAGGYFVLTGVMALAWPRMQLVWLFAIPMGYGIIIEFVQGASAMGRTGSFLDALANMAGVSAVVGFWWFFGKLTSR